MRRDGSAKESDVRADVASAKPVPHIHPVQALIFVVIEGAGVAWTGLTKSPAPVIVATVLALFLAAGVQVASQWEKAVVLRLGRFRALRGPGIFWMTPIVETISSWIDHRVRTSAFNAEQTLTLDTVPVDVDAVLFWHVWDAEKSALEVADYQQAVFWSAQTALRDIIGKTPLAEMLRGRDKLDAELQQLIDSRTTPWGITVQSVEIRDVRIPQGLQDAMSRQAQAERERQARVILGDAEAQIAQRFVEAGAAYKDHPTALHLRAMNMLYEGLKEKGALIVVPSTAVESMGLGTIAGLSALKAQYGASDSESDAGPESE